MIIEQYQIVIVNLDPTIGSEIKKTRPCVVLSPDEMNRHLRTITIAPITSQSKKYPTRVGIKIENQLNWIALDQIRTIDKVRIHKIVSVLHINEIRNVKSVIKEIFID